MALIILLALPVALGAAGLAALASRSAERRVAAREGTAEARTRAAEAADRVRPRTYGEIIERDGLGAAIDLAVERGRREIGELERDDAELAVAEQRAQAQLEGSSQRLLDENRGAARIAMLVVGSVLWLASSVLLFFLVRGVLLAMFESNDAVATPLAFVDVVIVAFLGLILHELIHPTGVLPGFRERPMSERIPSIVGLAVLVAAFLTISAAIAPARSDYIHDPKVAKEQQACSDARALKADAAAAGSSTVGAGDAIACGRAAAARETRTRARLWDQTAAIALPLTEMATSAFALTLVGLAVARRERRRVEGVQEKRRQVRRQIVGTTDRIIDAITEPAINAGFTAAQVNAELDARGMQAPPADPPPDTDGEADPDAGAGAGPAADADADAGAGAGPGAGAGEGQEGDPRQAPFGAYGPPGGGQGQAREEEPVDPSADPEGVPPVL
jgi:hypothetical protein